MDKGVLILQNACERCMQKSSCWVGLQFTCIIGRLISNEGSREGRGRKIYRQQEWESEL